MSEARKHVFLVATIARRDTGDCRAGAPPAARNKSATGAVALQIFIHPGADAFERLLDILDRVGHAETQIAFAEIAKRRPGETGYPRFVEQRVRQFLRGPARLPDVGEDVKCALRRPARE